ncbi:dephospho-CoA kinase [Pseudoroseicyclus sp. CXY001]|uniref:dephospho-CoA kinase n=1 Tax=Pseudoroseicyclus sp. CXY001 TaxID=3242492 RepID=UPI003570995A
MIALGLTGSIGTGKSTTREMFEAEGVATWDADAAVHRLYAPGGPAAAALKPHFPGAVTAEGGIDRPALSALVTADPDALKLLESLIHPLVAADREAFLASASAPVTLCDIPLLFETGLERLFAAIIVTTCPPAMQRARVLARPGMTEEKLAAILARQMPDEDKRLRADYTVVTDTMDHARAQVRAILAEVTSHA